jgi:F0F1-type ATP synthase gamma subunit
LCGSLNTQLFKHIHSLYDGKQATTDIVVIGKKAKEYFSRRGYNIIETLHVSDSIDIESAQSVVHTIHTHRSA